MIPMIVIFAVMALCVVLYLARPFFSALGPESDAELASYFAQIDAIKPNADIDADEADAAVTQLQRRILAKQSGAPDRSSTLINGTALLFIAVVGGAVYFFQGSPAMIGAASDSAAPVAAQTPASDGEAELRALVAQLETRLRNERADDPDGWLIYARSLMSLTRYDDALAAYDRVILLTEGNAAVVEEQSRARAFIAQQGGGAPVIDARPDRGPTEADIRGAEQMSGADRQAMINGMVDGLAERLKVAPNDPAGWARLIRARQVLGQTEQAAEDVALMRDVFADNPETVQDILDSAGWAE